MISSSSATERSGSIPFRPRARLIRLLGEELISDEVMAIVELVKNSYDADAHQVTVNLENIVDPASGCISIRDDGSGMDLNTVLYTWMEPATHHKRTKKSKKHRTSLGRVQLGEKGVGRFAADKLGSELELITRPVGSNEEVIVRVAWHHFDHDRYLDEVESTWSVREPIDFLDDTHGTLVRIHALRCEWTPEMVERLNNGLSRLVAPSATSTDFIITVHSSDFASIDGRVTNRLIESAPYRLAGLVNADGTLTVTDEMPRQIDLRMASQTHFRNEDGTLRMPLCGPFSVSVNIWDLEPLTGTGFGVNQLTRNAIKASSGVSVYRDGFRIWPYGEKDDDWLELNQRRVNNPTLRVSNNQIIGLVEITHSENPELRDRTSREGLLDTAAFFDLKALVVAVISELETERFARRRGATPERATNGSQPEDEVLKCLNVARTALKGGRQTEALRSALQKTELVYREQLEQEHRRYEQVSRLAGIGMAAELLTDSFSREVINATTILKALRGQTSTNAAGNIKEMIESLATRLDRINMQLDLMGPLYRSSAHESEPVNIAGAAFDAVTILAGRLTETRTQVTLTGDRTLTVRMNRGHVMQVLIILIENALSSLKEALTADPQISIEVVAENANSCMLVSDNGPGVAPNIEKLIFAPYFSTRRAGRGLGLHVARDILAAYNSSLELAHSKSSLSGACFEIRFDGRRITRDRVVDDVQNGA